MGGRKVRFFKSAGGLRLSGRIQPGEGVESYLGDLRARLTARRRLSAFVHFMHVSAPLMDGSGRTTVLLSGWSQVSQSSELA